RRDRKIQANRRLGKFGEAQRIIFAPAVAVGGEQYEQLGQHGSGFGGGVSPPSTSRLEAACQASAPEPRQAPTPSDFSLRWSADPSIPTTSAVREILPPKRLICAPRYSRSKISRASRSGIPMRCSPPSPLGRVGTRAPISGGSISAVIVASASPPARII